VERSGDRAWEKKDGAEGSAEREVAELERSVERAWFLRLSEFALRKTKT